jgi:hypothetical protein
MHQSTEILKGLSHEMFISFFASMDECWPECEPFLVLKIVRKLLILAAILSFGARHTKPSWIFLESLRRIETQSVILEFSCFLG